MPRIKHILETALKIYLIALLALSYIALWIFLISLINTDAWYMGVIFAPMALLLGWMILDEGF